MRKLAYENNLVELPISTRDGKFIARYSEKGLAELNFPNARASSRAVKSNSVPAKIKKWHRATETALKKVLAGKKSKLPPLDWTGKTEFQKSVWQQMLKISAGKTKSYGEISMAIGKPKAVRAVGGACGANPIPVLVPCHRVLPRTKNSAASPADWAGNAVLLKREGIKF